MTALVVRNARVWAQNRLFHGGVRIEDGVIATLEARPGRGGADVLDARGALLLPGAIDLHVHFRDPGSPHKEDFTSGSRSAVLGGVTTVLDMPNTRPAVMDAAALEAKQASIEGRSWVDFGLIGAADASNVEALAGLALAGAAAFKIFTYERRDPPPAGVVDDAILLELLRRAAATGLRAHVHAENDSLVKAGRLREQSSSDWGAHLRSREAIVEEEAVARMILLAREAGARLHICHLSSARGLARVREARRAGQDVTAEVTPQHLLLSDSVAEELGADLVMVPPVRHDDDRRALRDGLAGGDIDIVATDHAPHTEDDKQGAPLSISTGLVGVQWSYPLVLTEALAGRLPFARAVDAMSTRPARQLGWGARKGVIRPGADADLVIVDTAPGRLDAARLASRGRSTPFDGRSVAARVRTTLLAGRVQVDDGALVGSPIGRFRRPAPLDKIGEP